MFIPIIKVTDQDGKEIANNGVSTSTKVTINIDLLFEPAELETMLSGTLDHYQFYPEQDISVKDNDNNRLSLIDGSLSGQIYEFSVEALKPEDITVKIESNQYADHNDLNRQNASASYSWNYGAIPPIVTISSENPNPNTFEWYLSSGGGKSNFTYQIGDIHWNEDKGEISSPTINDYRCMSLNNVACYKAKDDNGVTIPINQLTEKLESVRLEDYQWVRVDKWNDNGDIFDISVKPINSNQQNYSLTLIGSGSYTLQAKEEGALGFSIFVSKTIFIPKITVLNQDQKLVTTNTQTGLAVPNRKTASERVTLIIDTIKETDDFDQSDITVSNGTIVDESWKKINSHTYQLNITASMDGHATVTIDRDRYQNNGEGNAAAEVSWQYEHQYSLPVFMEESETDHSIGKFIFTINHQLLDKSWKNWNLKSNKITNSPQTVDEHSCVSHNNVSCYQVYAKDDKCEAAMVDEPANGEANTSSCSVEVMLKTSDGQLIDSLKWEYTPSKEDSSLPTENIAKEPLELSIQDTHGTQINSGEETELKEVILTIKGVTIPINTGSNTGIEITNGYINGDLSSSGSKHYTAKIKAQNSIADATSTLVTVIIPSNLEGQGNPSRSISWRYIPKESSQSYISLSPKITLKDGDNEIAYGATTQVRTLSLIIETSTPKQVLVTEFLRNIQSQSTNTQIKEASASDTWSINENTATFSTEISAKYPGAANIKIPRNIIDYDNGTNKEVEFMWRYKPVSNNGNSNTDEADSQAEDVIDKKEDDKQESDNSHSDGKSDEESLPPIESTGEQEADKVPENHLQEQQENNDDDSQQVPPVVLDPITDPSQETVVTNDTDNKPANNTANQEETSEDDQPQSTQQDSSENPDSIDSNNTDQDTTSNENKGSENEDNAGTDNGSDDDTKLSDEVDTDSDVTVLDIKWPESKLDTTEPSFTINIADWLEIQISDKDEKGILRVKNAKYSNDDMVSACKDIRSRCDDSNSFDDSSLSLRLGESTTFEETLVKDLKNQKKNITTKQTFTAWSPNEQKTTLISELAKCSDGPNVGVWLYNEDRWNYPAGSDNTYYSNDDINRRVIPYDITKTFMQALKNYPSDPDYKKWRYNTSISVSDINKGIRALYFNCKREHKEDFILYAPSMAIQNGKALKNIEIHLKNSIQQLVHDTKSDVSVSLKNATDNQLICLSNTKHCEQATLSTTTNSNIQCTGGTCTVKAINGKATFEGLIVNGQAGKIYNLEFTFDAGGKIVSSLKYDNVEKTILATDSNTNYKSQVYIHSVGEISANRSIITVEKNIKHTESTAKITIKPRDYGDSPITKLNKELKISSDIGQMSSTEIINGSYVATLTAPTLKTATIYINVNNSKIQLEQKVVFSGEASSITNITQYKQVDWLNLAVNTNFKVEIKHKDIHIVPDADIVFEVISGGGYIDKLGTTSVTVSTDTEGIAKLSAGRWILGSGNNQLRATIENTSVILRPNLASLVIKNTPSNDVEEKIYFGDFIYQKIEDTKASNANDYEVLTYSYKSPSESSYSNYLSFDLKEKEEENYIRSYLEQQHKDRHILFLTGALDKEHKFEFIAYHDCKPNKVIATYTSDSYKELDGWRDSSWNLLKTPVASKYILPDRLKEKYSEDYRPIYYDCKYKIEYLTFPKTYIANASVLSSFRLEFRDSQDNLLTDLNKPISVSLVNNTEGAIKCKTADNACLQVRANAGVAIFNDLIVTGKVGNIYNLEFTYVDDDKNLSTLVYEQDDQGTKKVKTESETNAKSQVYIHSAGKIVPENTNVTILNNEYLDKPINGNHFIKKDTLDNISPGIEVKVQLRDISNNPVPSGNHEVNIYADFLSSKDGVITNKDGSYTIRFEQFIRHEAIGFGTGNVSVEITTNNITKLYRAKPQQLSNITIFYNDSFTSESLLSYATLIKLVDSGNNLADLAGIEKKIYFELLENTEAIFSCEPKQNNTSCNVGASGKQVSISFDNSIPDISGITLAGKKGNHQLKIKIDEVEKHFSVNINKAGTPSKISIVDRDNKCKIAPYVDKESAYNYCFLGFFPNSKSSTKNVTVLLTDQFGNATADQEIYYNLDSFSDPKITDEYGMAVVPIELAYPNVARVHVFFDFDEEKKPSKNIIFDAGYTHVYSPIKWPQQKANKIMTNNNIYSWDIIKHEDGNNGDFTLYKSLEYTSIWYEINELYNLDPKKDDRIIVNLTPPDRDANKQVPIQVIYNIAQDDVGIDQSNIFGSWLHYDGLNVDKAILLGHDRDDLKEYSTGYTGKDITVGIVGDGIDFTNPDLKHHKPKISGDLLQKQNNESTKVAGIIAAKGWNDIGIRGIAPDSKLIDIVVQKSRDPIISIFRDYLALGGSSIDCNHYYKYGSQSSSECSQKNKQNEHKYSTSSEIDIFHLTHQYKKAINLHTPNYKTLFFSGQSITEVFNNGNESKIQSTLTNKTQQKRIYITGVGDATTSQNLSIAQHPAIINVSSFVNSVPHNSSKKLLTTSPTTWITAPKGAPKNSNNLPVYTTCAKDDNSCDGMSFSFSPDYFTKIFYGTSASSAIVTGIVALILEAKPKLTWRDIKYILAKTAVQIDTDNKGWITNNAGFNYHNAYGFGLIDAEAAVKMAITFPDKHFGELYKIKPIPNNDNALILCAKESETVKEINISQLNIYVEQVELQLDSAPNNKCNNELFNTFIKLLADHIYTQNNLTIAIVSPSDKTIFSQEITEEQLNGIIDGSNPIKLSTNLFYGEKSAGNWKIILSDKSQRTIYGIKASLLIYGTKTDISKTTNP